MTLERPQLTQFRIEDAREGLIHLVFDMPDRSMNVFSNAAIHELGQFASWLKQSNARGVVIRSGKASAFCAGADLGELGVAYDMIVAAAPRDRFNIAFDHFFPLSKAIRALETAGKPVAAAIAGLALGGGCELALGAHCRVITSEAALGLPESLVGLLPGAGGTQRLPRLIGVDEALPVLLEGKRISGQDALDLGLAHLLVEPGEEVAAAENWLLSSEARASQPWDEADWQSPAVTSAVAQRRAAADPRNPAIGSILDCVAFGQPQHIEGGIRSEMSIFAHLIQRPEPRNMIQTLFLGKGDFDRASRKGELPEEFEALLAAAKSVSLASDDETAWRSVSKAVRPHGSRLDAVQKRMADYMVVSQAGFPAHIGGPFTFNERGFD